MTSYDKLVDMFFGIERNDNYLENVFEYDVESTKRIADIVRHYPMSLRDVAELIELVAPLATALTFDGLKKILSELTNQMETSNE